MREQRSAAHLSLRRLSELSGISNPYLSVYETFRAETGRRRRHAATSSPRRPDVGQARPAI